MNDDITVSIIIVSYNTKDLVVNCLASIAKAKTARDRWEIIVIDNGSQDGSGEALSRLKSRISNLHIIQNNVNVGFARGNNLGIKRAKGAYILLLNSDTEVLPGSIQEVKAFMEKNPHVGVSTCKVFLSSGEIDPACHRGFPTPWNAFTYFFGLEKLFPRRSWAAGYHQWYKDLETPHEIDSPSGAFYMVRHTVIDQVGLLDESFFMYGEDLDWSYRIKQFHWKIMYYPNVYIVHKKKQSGRMHRDNDIRKITDYHFYNAMNHFYDTHYKHLYPWIVTAGISLVIRMRIWLIQLGL